MSIRSEARIVGWPCAIALIPIILYRAFNEVEPVVDLFPPEPAREWLSHLHCRQCGMKTEHQLIEFRDEPVVTRECLECATTEAIWDLL